VSLVLGIADGLQKLLVAPYAANIYGRAGPFSLDIGRIPLPSLGPQAALEENLVPPAIPIACCPGLFLGESR
jgi:hypothetical protein